MLTIAGSWAQTLEVVRPPKAETGYAWPLERTPELTSSFGEYRPGRFHAGVDLRTNGVGLPVHALDGGEVERVRCSPWGYGKVVYVRQADGYTAVYAHLQAFEGALGDFVRAAQHTAQRYEVELTPAKGAFPVQPHQILARSGETGIGPPHLHLELRGVDGCPLNPHTAGLSWPDQEAPKIRGLIAVPLGEGSAIENRETPHEYAVSSDAVGHYATQTIPGTGRIAIGVDIMDTAPADHHLGVYRLRLLAVNPDTGETREHFRVQHDRIPYDSGCNAELAYYPFLPEKQGLYLLLARWPGNACDSYAGNTGDGVIDASKDALWRIEEEDFAGNIATIDLQIRAQSLTEPSAPSTASSRPGTISRAFFGERLIVSAEFPEPEREVPQICFAPDGKDGLKPMRRLDGRHFSTALFPGAAATYTLTVRHPRIPEHATSVTVARRGSPAQELSAEFGARVKIPSNAPYDWLPLVIETPSKTAATPFPILGKPVALWPDTAPLDVPVSLTIPLPTGTTPSKSIQIYRLDDAHWTALDTKMEGEGLTVSTRSLGVFVAMDDTSPPQLKIIAPETGNPIRSKRPKIAVSCEDTGSGIASANLWIGKHWLLAAYDPEAHRLTWEADEDLPPGRQSLSGIAVDRAGLETKASWVLNIP